jgi:hypothetical protein
MPLTYSSNLRLTLIGTGEQEGTWGDLTNTNIGALIEQAIAGYTVVNMTTDADKTLLDTNGAVDEARSMGLRITSTPSLTASRNIICPSVSKLYVVKNSTTGGQSIVVKTAAGTGVTIPNGKSTIVVCDGVNVTEAITSVEGFVPSGGIIMWSGSIATIPTGWYLCDGANGTPNLRDRFIVGAGSTYAVGTTGGSANATLVSHNHSVSGSTSNENNNHQHTFSGTTSGQTVNHTHTIPYGESPGSGSTGSGFPYYSSAFTAQLDYATSVNSNDHAHGYSGTTSIQNAGHAHTFTTTSSTEGTSATNANLPPYYALAYIMKA